MNKSTWIGLGIGLVAGIVVLGLLVKFGPSGLRDFLSHSRQVANPPSAGPVRYGLTTAQSPVRVIGGSITFAQANGWMSPVAGCAPTNTLDTCSYAALLGGQPGAVSFDAFGTSPPPPLTTNAETWEVDVMPAMDTGAAAGSLIRLCSSASLSSTTCGAGNCALLQVTTQPSGRNTGFYAPGALPYQKDPMFFKRYHDPIGCNATAGEFCEHIYQVVMSTTNTQGGGATTTTTQTEQCPNGECVVTIY
jgi:hypothetical protein